MPRRIPPILRTVRRGQHGPESTKVGQPALWNAKRRIKTSRGLSGHDWEAYKAHPDTFDWRNGVSPDVARFVDQNPNLIQTPEERKAILYKPSRYFSRPHNVPTSSRKQVYFPNFSVVLQRTPHLSPYYAAFIVPLWFSKLDLKSYLKELYRVDVLHVRSWVMPSHKGRLPSLGRRSQGERFRGKSMKKMTVQLVEPFVWPAEITDLEGTEYVFSIHACPFFPILIVLQMESRRILSHDQGPGRHGPTRDTMGQVKPQSASQNFDSAASKGAARGQEDVETNVDANTET